MQHPPRPSRADGRLLAAFATDSLHLMAAAANGTVHIFRSPREATGKRVVSTQKFHDPFAMQKWCSFMAPKYTSYK